MKHRFSFIVTLWWLLLLMSAGVFLLALAPREERLSDTENRTLSGRPEVSADSVLSGEFMTGFESWLSDSFFTRDSVISFTDTLLAATSLNEEGEVDMEERLLLEQKKAEELLKETEEETAEKTEEAESLNETEFHNDTESDDGAEVSVSAIEDTETEMPAEEEDQAFEGKAWFWLEKTDGSKTGVYTFSEKNIDTVVNMLNAYRDALGEDGTVHYMQIPFSQLAYRWLNNTKTYCGWGCNVEDALRAKVNDGIYVHNIPEILLEHMQNGEYLYYRLDHHWTPLSASYAVNAMMESQGYPTVDYDEYEYTVHEKFYGSHYDASDMDRMRKLADRLEVMHPLMPTKHYLVKRLDEKTETELMNYNHKSYTAFMFGTRGPWRVIDTGYDTGRTALIICDSFGTSFTPYILPYYDTVVVTDLRPDYYDKKAAGGSVRDYIEHYGVDDIYMVMSTVSSVNNQYSLSYMMKYLD
ncbi:MAG: hypothetical protein IJC48_05160 [Clostridia bacterium]|nr:hypothetical protein [Clostridia bacterium]